jgi:hypothetical protein
LLEYGEEPPGTPQVGRVHISKLLIEFSDLPQDRFRRGRAGQLPDLMRSRQILVDRVQVPINDRKRFGDPRFQYTLCTRLDCTVVHWEVDVLCASQAG